MIPIQPAHVRFGKFYIEKPESFGKHKDWADKVLSESPQAITDTVQMLEEQGYDVSISQQKPKHTFQQRSYRLNLISRSNNQAVASQKLDVLGMKPTLAKIFLMFDALFMFDKTVPIPSLEGLSIEEGLKATQPYFSQRGLSGNAKHKLTILLKETTAAIYGSAPDTTGNTDDTQG